MDTYRPEEAWAFAQLDEFWERYRPLTPWGKDAAEARPFIADRAELERRYDDVEAALGFLADRAGDPSSLDRASYHLRRMPRLALEAKDSYELIELFQIKKFIANYRGARSVLGEPLALRFGMEGLADGSAAKALAAELDRGGSDPETFYLADCYDGGLAEARARVAAADAAIRSERVRAEAGARLDFGVGFDGREFLVLPKETTRAMMAAAGSRFSAEPFDDARYVVRVMPSDAALEAMSDRERALADERLAEERVIARISALAAAAMPELSAAVAATARWDLARAGAVLAREFGMTRPRLDSGSLALERARFEPCAWECGRLGLGYTPLTAEFRSCATVLFGSNMGGKTVVLKTLLFFQLLAQAGLFVPADRFETRVYARVAYVGELTGERLAGLSGFGLELWRLMRARGEDDDMPAAEGADACGAALAQAGEPAPSGAALIAFDELARTTGSHEAEALLSAVVESYSGGPGSASSGNGDRAFFATHFRGVARLPGVEYRRMRGLDREAAAAAISSAGGAGIPGGGLEGRLAGINKHMRYEVVDDDGSGSESDALAIASLLGLDGRIVERARYYLTKDGL